LAPVLRQRFELSLSVVGVALGAITLGFAVMMLPWGLLADRVGERRVIASGMAAAALALSGAAAAPSAPLLAACLFAAGLFGSSAIAASGRAIVGAFPFHRRAMALGLRQMAVPLGGAAAAASLPALAHDQSLPTVFLALAGGCLLSSVLAVLLLPPHDVHSPAPKARARAWRNWPLGIGAALLVFVQFSLLAFLVVYLHQRGLSTSAAAALLVVVQIAGAIGRLACGGWSDRIGDRIGPLRYTATLTCAATVLIAVTAASTAGATIILMPIAAVIAMSWNGLANTAAAELAGPQRSGAALGFQNGLLAITGALAPAAFGGLAQAASWPCAFALLAACAAAATISLGRIPQQIAALNKVPPACRPTPNARPSKPPSHPRHVRE
jgi:sugar phosphate permease